MKIIPQAPRALREALFKDVREDNNKLFADEDILSIKNLVDSIIAKGVVPVESGTYYISKKHLKDHGIPADFCKYSIIKHDNNYYAVFPGKMTDSSGKTKETVLGRGQYGAAKLVQNLDNGEWAVVKTQKLDQSTRTSRHNEGRMSIRVGLAVAHFETSSSKDNTGRHKMLMKYVPGIELKDFLNDYGGHAFEDNSYLFPQLKGTFAKIGYEERLQIALAVLKKVAELENLHISHGDLHSGNIKYYKPEQGGLGDIEFLDFGNGVDLLERLVRDEKALAANPNDRNLQKNLQMAKEVLPYKDIQNVLRKVIAPLLGIGDKTFNQLSRPNSKLEAMVCDDCCFIDKADLTEMNILVAFKTLINDARIEGKPYPSAMDAIKTIENLTTLMKSNKTTRELEQKMAVHTNTPQSQSSSLRLTRSQSKLSLQGSLTKISPSPPADSSLAAYTSGRSSKNSSKASLSPAKSRAGSQTIGSKSNIGPAVSQAAVSSPRSNSALSSSNSIPKVTRLGSQVKFFKEEVPPSENLQHDAAIKADESLAPTKK